MSINQRQHIRFSLDIPAIIYSKFGEKQLTRLQQISIGGCFTDWDDSVLIGDEFRMEIELPNKNYLPLHCKALYLFEHTGIGVRFVDITKFEQSLISKTSAKNATPYCSILCPAATLIEPVLAAAAGECPCIGPKLSSNHLFLLHKPASPASRAAASFCPRR